MLSLVYSPPKQKEMLQRIANASFDAYSAVQPKDRLQIVKEACTALLYAVYSLKHPSFTGEAEWRIVSQDASGKECFRVDGGQIVPYVEIPVNSGDIDHIVQGPGIYREASGAAITRFASLQGFGGITVKPSRVPLG